jgi:1,4-dihydroxy-2-naphthoyl-CoA hydrolase
MFTYRTKVRIYDSDAAGILFFGNQFRLMHEAFEEYLESKGTSPAEYINDPEYLLPVVHAEADYKRPIHAGDKLTIQLNTEKIGTTSVTLAYIVLNEDDQKIGSGKIVAVAVSKKTWQKVPIPEKFRKLLK